MPKAIRVLSLVFIFLILVSVANAYDFWNITKTVGGVNTSSVYINVDLGNLFATGNISTNNYFGSGKYLTDIIVNNTNNNYVINANNGSFNALYESGSQVCTAANGICPSGNSSWNQSYADTLYAPIGSESFSGLNTMNIYGATLTLNDGDLNRQYTQNYVSVVAVDNAILQPTVDYTYISNITTFLNPIWDTQYITFYYTATNNTILINNYFGATLTLSSGDENRQFTISGTLQILAVDNYILQRTMDYTLNNGTITFINPIWDDQLITVWYVI